MKATNYVSVCKPRFFILSIKKFLLPFLFFLFTVCLVIFSKSNMSAAKSGLLLWANNVIPSLLPFFIATELLSHTNIISKISKLLNPIMRPIFNVPGLGAYALIMGIISGYPIGAKIVTKFREDNLCTKEEAERLLAYTNNSGPLFIIATVGISMFGNSTIGFLLLITHILSCITVGFIFRFWKYKKNTYHHNTKFNISSTDTVSFSNLGEVMSKSIVSSINTITIIGGFIVLFSVIISILDNSNFLNILSKTLYPIFHLFGFPNIYFVNGFLSGILELTNGLKLISNICYKQITTNIILTAFLLGFGGISILLQVLSIISKSDLSIKPYIIGKILQAFLATIYTILFIHFIPIFNLNL